MNRYPFRQFTKAVWIPGWDSIASMAAPTAIVLNDAGNTDVSCFLTADGLSIGISTSKISGPSLCTQKNSESVDGVSSDPSLKGYRDNETGGDTFWDIAIRNSQGFLAVRRGIASAEVFVAAQKVEIYKAIMGEPSPDNTADNAYTTFMLPLAFDDWELKAVVA